MPQTIAKLTKVVSIPSKGATPRFRLMFDDIWTLYVPDNADYTDALLNLKGQECVIDVKGNQLIGIRQYRPDGEPAKRKTPGSYVNDPFNVQSWVGTRSTPRNKPSR